MYVPPRPDDELPRFGLRTWTAVVAFAGVCLVVMSAALLEGLPKLENTSASAIAHAQDVVQVQLGLAIAGLVAGLTAHAMAWLSQRRASLVLCGIAGLLFGAAILLLALTF